MDVSRTRREPVNSRGVLESLDMSHRLFERLTVSQAAVMRKKDRAVRGHKRTNGFRIFRRAGHRDLRHRHLAQRRHDLGQHIHWERDAGNGQCHGTRWMRVHDRACSGYAAVDLEVHRRFGGRDAPRAPGQGPAFEIDHDQVAGLYASLIGSGRRDEDSILSQSD